MNPAVAPVTGVAITNPLVLYRALVATKKITQDPSQYRLAIHLQKLYDRLKDYEPTVEYSHRLKQLNQAVSDGDRTVSLRPQPVGTRGIWTSLLERRQQRESLALARILTSHEHAVELDSPKGLMLHGEVGTGKSMLIDLFADCLPNQKKRRLHFNTFILETIGRLEELRRARVAGSLEAVEDEHSLLWLARDLIQTSPILFLDEFQLPDRAASKIMSNLMTGFFQLGGVLIATSNRMPEELDKAAGMQFSPPPSRMESLSWKFGIRKPAAFSANKSEFADFLDVLKARCEVWEMEGVKDYRRSEYESLGKEVPESDEPTSVSYQPVSTTLDSEEPDLDAMGSLPKFYFVKPSSEDDTLPGTAFATSVLDAELFATGESKTVPWTTTSLTVYGRKIPVSKHHKGVTCWSFDELCAGRFGPADYLTLASTFHTLILHDVPVINLAQKNEARRFITLLDALYEARCKLIITGAAGPDDTFFPKSRGGNMLGQIQSHQDENDDSVYAETFSEAYQDATAPFRPNISSYESQSSSGPDYTHARLSGILSEDALEDDPPNRMRRMSCDFVEEDEQEQKQRGPDFSQTGAFTGEDERFAYKRARSRLWEMCGAKWWARQEEGWWKPLEKDVRRWEGSRSNTMDSAGQPHHQDPSPAPSSPVERLGTRREVNEKDDEVMFRHGASPFRTALEPPPKIGWTHAWGMVKWGKKAGPWGQGVEGLKERKKSDDGQ